jgi:hypothetical protein
MKKMILTAALMLSVAGALLAQTTRPGNGNPGTNKSSPTYVDANKNNVCDNYENRKGTANTNRAQSRRGNGCGAGNGQGCCRMPGRRAGGGRR